MIKSELPRFFQLKAVFIQPLFENLFNMQSRIYGMMYARCYELLNQNMDTFITNTYGIEEGYNYRKSQHDVRAEFENMDLFKSGGKAWLVASGGANNSRLTLQERAAIKQAEASGSAPQAIEYGGGAGASAYGAAGGMTKAQEAYGGNNGYGQQQQQQEYASPPPPAYNAYNNSPQPQQGRSAQKFVVALYDYTAQAEGDLSFKKDDRIEIIQKTADTNDWWTGRLNGLTGVFPGNYVQEF
jgi:amphiphysin